MKTIKYIPIFLLGIALFSCESQQPDKLKTEFNVSATIKTVSIDSFYIDESEINGEAEYTEYRPSSSKINSPFQTELNNALKNESIGKYYKEIYQKEKLILADDNIILSITDSLFTTDSETDLFYFIVFTKSMNGADGFYSEAIGLSAFNFVTEKTEWFADYFNITPKLTDKDMDNWANYIYSEIQIVRENEELKAIRELESKLLSNIKEARKEYKSVIEKLIEKIKKNNTVYYKEGA